MQQRLGIGYGQLAVERDIFELNRMLLQPLAIRMLGGDLVLDFIVANDAALLSVNHQHTTGAETVLLHNGGGIDVHHTHLGGQHNGIILGDIIT